MPAIVIMRDTVKMMDMIYSVNDFRNLGLDIVAFTKNHHGMDSDFQLWSIGAWIGFMAREII